MIGIKNIASYIPEKRISNFDRKDEFDIDDRFIREKIGIQSVSRKEEKEEPSDLCVKAYRNLEQKEVINPDLIEVVIVVTQNPDYNLPHTAAIVQKKLGLGEDIASFDISLGCSGFVYGLSVIQSFMVSNGFKTGLLFTADPYSKIINQNDKNTSLLFGDAAAVTLITNNPQFETGKFTFGTIGEGYKELICDKDLFMNGRSIFTFAAKYVPKDVNKVLEKNETNIGNVDIFAFHQGSKYISDTLTRRIKLDPDKVPFEAVQYGNTVSSSLPLLIEKYFEKANTIKSDTILLSGFGVGLSWSSTLLFRTK